MKKYAKISFILVLALMVTTISAFASARYGAVDKIPG